LEKITFPFPEVSNSTFPSSDVLDEPATILTDPPFPLLLCPTDRFISPLFPPVLDPLAMIISPLLPVLDVPLDNIILPLLPSTLAFGDLIDILPLPI
jgi:hypothetical protein